MLEQPARRTAVSFLLDRSGWMELLKDETIAGVNAFLDALEREAGDLVDFARMQFNDADVETLCTGARLPAVPRLTTEIYEPRGGPALIDPCHAGIKAIEETIVGRADQPRVLVIIHVADENDDWCDPRMEELRSLIERRSDEGWCFKLLAAEIDGYSLARSLGIDTDATISFSGLPGSVNAITAAGEIVGAFAQGRTDRVSFTTEQKRAAGDRYFDSVISDDAIERAMRVYTVEEAMDGLRCITPGPPASTDRWEEFLADMPAGPQTPSAQKAIEEAKQELARRAAGVQPEPPPLSSLRVC